jgi:hypothetical protein
MAGVADRSAVRLPDQVGVGVLTSAFPPELVELAIEEWDAREQRTRMLPARLMAYYTMACTMYFDDAYPEVWNKLLTGLEWARRYRQRRAVRMQPTAAALTKARQRLGPEVMAAILEAVMTPLPDGPDQAPWAYFHGLRVLAVDGFTMNVAKTPDNVAAFGMPSNEDGAGAYPQVRVVALAETGPRSLQGAQVGPLADGEQSMARKLWPRLERGDVVVGDRNFLSHADLTAVLATGAHAVFRVKADVDLPVLRVLPDGSFISRIADPNASRRLRRKGLRGEDIPGIEVRVIEYTVTGDPEDPLGAGAPSELFCLATTLTDEHAYPMEGFPDLYHDRWQLETAIGDVETRLRGGPDAVLRSRLPELVYQEVYGLLCVYQAIRALINAGAEHAGLDPDRVSFTRAKQAAARHLSDAAAFSPL